MLAPELTKELQYIEIAASRRIRSLRYGQSRSPIRGSGYEFETHRKYVVGEDLRQVDWNVSARMQELYIKRHFEEKEITVFLVVDVSRSMYFSTAAHSKRMRVRNTEPRTIEKKIGSNPRIRMNPPINSPIAVPMAREGRMWWLMPTPPLIAARNFMKLQFSSR